MAGVGPIRLRASLRATQRGRIGRLGQMSLGADALELLNDEAPARARLDRKGGLLILDPPQPCPQMLAIGWSYAAATNLPALGIYVLERDLSAVKIETTNDAMTTPSG
jgi:hypothetical protein